MKINFKSKILVKGLLVLLAFSLFSSTAFAEKTYLHIVLQDIKCPATAEEVERILNRCPRWINEVDGTYSPIHLACLYSGVDVVRTLLYRGACADVGCSIDGTGISPSGSSIVGCSPLHLAAKRGDSAMIRSLRANVANVNFRDSLNLTPLHYAVIFGNVEAVRALLESPSVGVDYAGTFMVDNYVTPLCIASRKGYVNIARLLLDRGANVNFRDADGWTPLHYAARCEDLRVIQLLVIRHADITAKTAKGASVLHWAVSNNTLEAVSYLVENGADVNVADHNGETPLHWAVKKNKIEVAKFLVSKGSYVYRKDIYDKTPLAIAEDRGDYDFAQALLNCRST